MLRHRRSADPQSDYRCPRLEREQIIEITEFTVVEILLGQCSQQSFDTRFVAPAKPLRRVAVETHDGGIRRNARPNRRSQWSAAALGGAFQ